MSNQSPDQGQLLMGNDKKTVRKEGIEPGVPVVFKTKCELKCQNELFLKYHFSGDTSFYVFITEII